MLTPSCAAFCLSTSTLHSTEGYAFVEEIFIKPGIFSVRYFSILLAASLTKSSVFAYIASSIGESKDGPPRTGFVSTIIPGISFVEFVTSSMTSNPDIDLS